MYVQRRKRYITPMTLEQMHLPQHKTPQPRQKKKEVTAKPQARPDKRLNI
jgi:hypothetical protein